MVLVNEGGNESLPEWSNHIHPSESCVLCRPTKLQAASVEHDNASLKRDVAKDRESDACITLDSTETVLVGTINRCIRDDVSWNSNKTVANTKDKVRWSRAARENITALVTVILGTLDLFIVCFDDRLG